MWIIFDFSDGEKVNRINCELTSCLTFYYNSHNMSHPAFSSRYWRSLFLSITGRRIKLEYVTKMSARKSCSFHWPRLTKANLVRRLWRCLCFLCSWLWLPLLWQNLGVKKMLLSGGQCFRTTSAWSPVCCYRGGKDMVMHSTYASALCVKVPGPQTLPRALVEKLFHFSFMLLAVISLKIQKRHK